VGLSVLPWFGAVLDVAWRFLAARRGAGLRRSALGGKPMGSVVV
jgi:hypothetical protein